MCYTLLAVKVWFAVGFKTGTGKISCDYFGRHPARPSAKSQLSDPTPADTAGRHGRTALPTIATDPNKPFEWIFVLFIWHKWHPESHGARTTPQRGMEEKILQTLTPIYLVEVKNLYSYRYLGNNGVFHSLRQNTSKDFWGGVSLPKKDLIVWKYWSFDPLHFWSPSCSLQPRNCSTWSCKVFWSGLLDLGCILSWSVVI